MTLRDAGLTSQSILTVSSALVENNPTEAFTLAVVRMNPVEVVNVKVKPTYTIAYVRAMVVKSTVGGTPLRPCLALERGNGEILRDDTKVAEVLHIGRVTLKETEVESPSQDKQQQQGGPSLQRTGISSHYHMSSPHPPIHPHILTYHLLAHSQSPVVALAMSDCFLRSTAATDDTLQLSSWGIENNTLVYVTVFQTKDRMSEGSSLPTKEGGLEGYLIRPAWESVRENGAMLTFQSLSSSSVSANKTSFEQNLEKGMSSFLSRLVVFAEYLRHSSRRPLLLRVLALLRQIVSLTIPILAFVLQLTHRLSNHITPHLYSIFKTIGP